MVLCDCRITDKTQPLQKILANIAYLSGRNIKDGNIERLTPKADPRYLLVPVIQLVVQIIWRFLVKPDPR